MVTTIKRPFAQQTPFGASRVSEQLTRPTKRIAFAASDGGGDKDGNGTRVGLLEPEDEPEKNSKAA